MTRLLGLIPARSGSVRLPGKNGLEIDGKSLIARSVEAALASTELDEVDISTDSDGFAALAAAAGLVTAYRRPQRLNHSDTSSADVVLDYLCWRRERAMPDVSHVLLLQPTSPQCTASDIDAAVRTWRDSGRDSLISVMPAGNGPGSVVIEDTKTGRLASGAATVDDGAFYVLDGMFFLTSAAMLIAGRGFWDADSALYVNIYPRPHDIDTEADFTAARCLIEANAFDIVAAPRSGQHKKQGSNT